MQPFHLAIPVHDLEQARAFYGDLLGLPQGRDSKSWIDYNLFGHQLVVHLGSSNFANSHFFMHSFVAQITDYCPTHHQRTIQLTLV